MDEAPGTLEAEDILELWQQRKKARGPVLERMESIKDAYNGDVIVPLPELDKDERPFVANMLQMGLDNYGMRIASVMPTVECPPINPRSDSSIKRGDTRRRAVLGWWELNKQGIKLRRRARHLVGYSASPVLIRPDFKRGIPMWEPRNPLSAFPAATLDPDDLTPEDCIFAVKRTLRELRLRYPSKAGMLGRDEDDMDQKIDVLEYTSGDWFASVAVNMPGAAQRNLPPAVMLEKVPNRANMCLAVVPGRVTLDRPQGQFDGILGMYQMQAKLMALEVLAVQKGVFPDTYLISRPNETAKFIAGPYEGFTGQINEIEGGDIKTVDINPGFATNQTIDRLERAQRLTGGIPAEFGGESGNNIRTGRRGQDILSAVVDFPVQEAQQLLGASLQEENRRAIAVAKAYFGSTPKTFFTTWKNAKGKVTYTPATDFETDHNVVTYAQAGSDINNLTIGLGQRVGIGTLSKDTAMRLDPMVDDPEVERDKVTAEALEAALLASIQQQASSGAIPPHDLARIMKLVQQDVSLPDAIQQAQQEAQARQAQQTPPTAPEAMPGLAQPGMGAEAGMGGGPPGSPQAAAISQPGPSMQNLAGLMSTLRGVNRPPRVAA